MSSTSQPSAAPKPLEYGPPITHEQAKRIVAAAETEALANSWPMAIAIVDCGANLVIFHKLDHTQLGSVAIAQRKAETAVKMKRPTKLLEDAVINGGPGLRILSLDGVVTLEGGVPILVDGKIIGAIGVSGMSSAQDGIVAAAGIKALSD